MNGINMQGLPCSAAQVSALGGTWTTIPGGALMALLPDGSVWIAGQDGWVQGTTDDWQDACD